jgi:hypothetical protein
MTTAAMGIRVRGCQQMPPSLGTYPGVSFEDPGGVEGGEGAEGVEEAAAQMLEGAGSAAASDQLATMAQQIVTLNLKLVETQQQLDSATYQLQLSLVEAQVNKNKFPECSLNVP